MRDTTIEELEENVQNFFNLPSVPVKMTHNGIYTYVPNYIFHEDISAIWGESIVKNILDLHAVRMFLKN